MDDTSRGPRLARSARPNLFQSFFIGGFECSTHRTTKGRRLDLVASTRHDRFAREDYARLRACGLLTAREGIRWHLIEKQPGRFDFSSVRPLVEASREADVEVIWDLLHYGWPDHLDLWSPSFADRLADLARAFAFWMGGEGAPLPFVTPINEISFFAWAAAEEGHFFPYAHHRGAELKAKLVRAAIAAIRGIWDVSPHTRIVHTEPVINVVSAPKRPQDRLSAERYRLAQYEALEMITGRQRPELGGEERYADIVGLNYYHDNQWYFGSGRKIRPGHRDYRPLRDMLVEWYRRFRRPMLIAETGIENAARPRWLRFVCREVELAREAGADFQGVCLYPILNQPGWTNDRHCHNGLWDYADASGRRRIYDPLARELHRQIELHSTAAAEAADRAS